MRLIRSRELRAYDRGETTTILGEDGALRELSGASAELVRAILAFVTSPRTPEEIAAHLSELAGAPVEISGVVADAIALLRDARALQVFEPSPPAMPTMPRARRRLVLALTGAIATATAPTLIPILQRRGFDVRVAATRRALRLVSSLALEAITHARVASSMWSDDPQRPVPHLELASWAELVLVWPASASSIARIASGNCSTLVSAIAVSARAPVVVVPSMNDRMASSPSVARNVEQLRDDGFFVVHPGIGFEVAERPAARAPMLGTSPSHLAVAGVVEAIAERHAPRAIAPSSAWDALFATTPAETLPWFTERIEDDVAALLDEHAGGRGRLLDIGTGTGGAAIDAARRGFAVVATDVSPRALELASARAGDLPIAFVEDDAGASKLRGSFDVVLDRGCLHTLPRERHADYAASVAARMKPGALFLLKVMSADEPGELGVHRFSVDELRALFARDLEVVTARASMLEGPSGGRRALLLALRKRAG